MWEAAWVSDHKTQFMHFADTKHHTFQVYQGLLSAEDDADVGDHKPCASFLCQCSQLRRETSFVIFDVLAPAFINFVVAVPEARI